MVVSRRGRRLVVTGKGGDGIAQRGLGQFFIGPSIVVVCHMPPWLIRLSTFHLVHQATPQNHASLGYLHKVANFENLLLHPPT